MDNSTIMDNSTNTNANPPAYPSPTNSNTNHTNPPGHLSPTNTNTNPPGSQAIHHLQHLHAGIINKTNIASSTSASASASASNFYSALPENSLCKNCLVQETRVTTTREGERQGQPPESQNKKKNGGICGFWGRRSLVLRLFIYTVVSAIVGIFHFVQKDFSNNFKAYDKFGKLYCYNDVSSYFEDQRERSSSAAGNDNTGAADNDTTGDKDDGDIDNKEKDEDANKNKNKDEGDIELRACRYQKFFSDDMYSRKNSAIRNFLSDGSIFWMIFGSILNLLSRFSKYFSCSLPFLANLLGAVREVVSSEVVNSSDDRNTNNNSNSNTGTDENRRNINTNINNGNGVFPQPPVPGAVPGAAPPRGKIRMTNAICGANHNNKTFLLKSHISSSFCKNCNGICVFRSFLGGFITAKKPKILHNTFFRNFL